MNKKALFAILGAILTATVSVYLVNFYIGQKEQSLFKGMELVDVLIVTKDLDAGTEITKSVLAKRQLPKKYTHGNSVSLKDVNLVVGQTLNFPLQENDPLLWTDLGEMGEQLRIRGLADSISKGERALSIPVDMVSGVSGLLSPGDRIDILSTVRNPATGEDATITLLQNITVLAVGSSTSERRGGSYGTITLQVTLEEAELLVFSGYKGRLIAVLRNPEDIATFNDIPKVDFKNVLKSDYRNTVQNKRNKIEVIKQGKTTQ